VEAVHHCIGAGGAFKLLFEVADVRTAVGEELLVCHLWRGSALAWPNGLLLLEFRHVRIAVGDHAHLEPVAQRSTTAGHPATAECQLGKLGAF